MAQLDGVEIDFQNKISSNEAVVSWAYAGSEEVPEICLSEPARLVLAVERSDCVYVGTY